MHLRWCCVHTIVLEVGERATPDAVDRPGVDSELYGNYPHSTRWNDATGSFKE